MNKFKVGDKVRVAKEVTIDKTQRIQGEFENTWYAEGMNEYCGNVYTIKRVDRLGVRFEEDCSEYGFPPAMLNLASEIEKAEEKEEMINFQVGQNVYCLIFGKGEVRETTSYDSDPYPIYVVFESDDNGRYFTTEGKYYEYTNRTLFFSEPKIEAAKQPLFESKLIGKEVLLVGFDGDLHKGKVIKEDAISIQTDKLEHAWLKQSIQVYSLEQVSL